MRALVTGLMVAATGIAAAHAQGTQAAVAKPPSRAEFRVGGFMVSGERTYDFVSNVQSATGSIKGVELLLRGGGIGLYFRSLSGEFDGQPQVVSADARLLLFPPAFTVFGGVGKRALSSELATNVRDVAMVGVSSTVSIGGTGVRTHVSVAALVSPDNTVTTSPAAGDNPASTGLEGEAAIFYKLPRAPLFLSLGYRTELFTTKAASLETPEEVRGLRLGAGLQFGGR